MPSNLAILYQAHPPPVIDGIVKPMKESGYADSGADIALGLRQMGVDTLTPDDSPNPKVDLDWVFPDTTLGIEAAIKKGADTFWLNTVLYKGHPVLPFIDQGYFIIGQEPSMVHRYDDKWFTNKILRKHNISVNPTQLISESQSSLPILSYPVVVKPIRGRGSQGVQLIGSKDALHRYLEKFFKTGLYGNKIIVEPFLPGLEITLTVMPPGDYQFGKDMKKFSTHWCLHPVGRYNHEQGIAPYSGKVAVTANSKLLPKDILVDLQIKAIIQQCAYAGQILEAKAPIRIDCRADKKGVFQIFDVNLKPNMTGASRPHRADQDSLSTMAARHLGWSYGEFVHNIMNQRWRGKVSEVI